MFTFRDFVWADWQERELSRLIFYHVLVAAGRITDWPGEADRELIGTIRPLHLLGAKQ